MHLLRTRIAADLSLLAVVAAWGYTFVPIKEVTADWPRHWMTFVALRFWIATATFVPLLLWRRRRHTRGTTVVPGLLTGCTMLLGYGLQTAGLVHTTPSIAGFLTGLSVVLVPVGARLLGRPVPGAAVLGMGIATVGLTMLIEPGNALGLGPGELLVLGCAVSFAAQILLTDRFAARVDPVLFTAAQCAITAVGASAYALWFEIGPHGWPDISGLVWSTAVFCGVIGTTVSFLVQTMAQRVTPATHVALIYATEPVFAAFFAWLLLPGEQLTGRMQAGCALILTGMLCAEVGPRLRRR